MIRPRPPTDLCGRKDFVKNFRAPARTDSGRRPTVLVADDNALILKKVSALLAPNFDVVATVTDGQQALKACLLLDPDVVVLDVSMPELDGFQVARALTRASSRAAIVMLTMHGANEYVGIAFESGARGYVVKTRMHLDLQGAIDHVLAGRMFVPVPSSLLAFSPLGSGGHTLQLRLDGSAFIDELSGLVSASLSRDGMAVVVTTGETRTGIESRLAAEGCDLARAAARGTYVPVDADAYVAAVLAEKRFDVNTAAAAVEELERSRRAVSATHVTLIGEVTAMICRAGKPDVAIEREFAWSELMRGLPFVAVCSFPLPWITGDADSDLFRGVCASHGTVCHARTA